MSKFTSKTVLASETIIKCLKTIKGPDFESDIVSLGLVSPIVINDGKVIFSITVSSELTQQLEPMRLAAQNAVSKLDGVTQATVILTGERAGHSSLSQGSNIASPPPPSPPPASSSPQNMASHQARSGSPVSGIKSIIAVASGKGGVGKSTTSVNLALALANLGQKTAILDADIYGPSMPRLMGITRQPEVNGKILTPLEEFGVKVMSMGFLVNEETPMIWRGPMVISALNQMLREVAWGELDILVVDMPPGTGDAQLTMSQNVPLAGAVIVSTPQDIALIDARKGLNMFRKVDVPILGIVENMSIFICPKCGEHCEIFGHGGAREEAEKLGIPFLGEVPLHIDIRKNSDSGTPIVASEPNGPHALIYTQIAQNIIDKLHLSSFDDMAPNIIFE